MAEVQSGRADFKAILVYDVSRWGRFEDADEGAYHEHVCSRAGIRVHYCGEQFENDGSFRSKSSLGNAVSSSLAIDRAAPPDTGFES